MNEPQTTSNDDDDINVSSTNDVSKDGNDLHINSSTSNEQNSNNTTTDHHNIKWSKTLSTPTTLSHLLSPTTDHTSLKHNQHGLGLKYAIDRSKILSRTGKGCSALLLDIASIHDELSIALYKCRSSVLLDATNNTPLSIEFINNINQCISSYVTSTLSFGTTLKNDISKEYTENSIKLGDECIKQYTKYTTSRSNCAHSRKEALKLRKKYLEAVKEVDVAINSLKKGRITNNAKGRKRTYTGSSTESYNNSKDELNTSASIDDGVDESAGSWQHTLRTYGNEHSLSKQCESLIRATEEVTKIQTNYVDSVKAENVAVDNCVNIEKVVLDEVQKLEEERIVFLIGLFDRFLQEEKESLERMALDLPPESTEPLNFESTSTSDDNAAAPPPPSPSAAPSATTSPSIFMSPRRRAGTDDGPAINETRMLNLPDNIADIRDNMKTTINKQLSRLKTIKIIVSFNDNMANAIETFANNLKSLIENNPSNRKSQKNNVLYAWNAAIGSLEIYAKNADMLSRQIRKGNSELQQILSMTEKETKTLQEKEEYRWKSLCDASKVESKAKLKQKQYVAELEKAKARLTLAEGDGDNHTDATGTSSSSTSPKRKTQATTTMDQHMNKAMGKMFSILPSEGKDVMNKVLTPQQRLAIAKRQLDEAQSKESKGTESFEVAQSVKQQAVVSYETEAEACQIKFREDERNEWSMMHQTLISSVTALKDFRNVHLQSVKSSIDDVKEQHLQDKALEDVTRWTTFTEKRLKDHRDRIIDESKDNGEDGMFRLKVQLVECTNVEEAVRAFMEEDVDEDIDFMVEDDTVSPGLGSPMKESNGDSDIKGSSVTSSAPLPEVPPDTFIGKMDSIFSKKLKNVSIEEYYTAGWSEDVPLYQPWLERKGSFDVSVSDWEESADGEFVNDWSKEKFTHKRVIKFKFKRTTHLYIGPPIAGVTQTQYLIKDGNDKCVVMMTVEMDGIPYSDSFAVEVRWAARRLKENDIAIDAGVIVRFTKSNMFASKIKSGTLKETSPIHLDLFEEIKSAIASSDGGEGDTDMEDTEEEAKEEATSSTRVESEPATTTSPKDGGIVHRVVSSFLSMPKLQILLGVGVLYFGANILLSSRRDANANAIAELSHKVDDLSREVKEMKAMLEAVLKHSANQSGQRSEL